MRQFVVQPWSLPSDQSPTPHTVATLDEAETWINTVMPPNNGATVYEIEVTVHEADDGLYEKETDITLRQYVSVGGGYTLDEVIDER